MDNKIKPEENRFYEGRWIGGIAYVVCMECGAFIPADQTNVHLSWHNLLIEMWYK